MVGIALRETGFPVFPFSRTFFLSRSRTGNFEFLVRETGNWNTIDKDKLRVNISETEKYETSAKTHSGRHTIAVNLEWTNFKSP